MSNKQQSKNVSQKQNTHQKSKTKSLKQNKELPIYVKQVPKKRCRKCRLKRGVKPKTCDKKKCACNPIIERVAKENVEAPKTPKIGASLVKVPLRSSMKVKSAFLHDDKKFDSAMYLSKVFSKSLYTRITDGTSKFAGLCFSQRKLFKFGERDSGTKTQSGEPQDFYQIRDEQLKTGTLFEDPEFPAIDSSLFYSEQPDPSIEWKRPWEIVNDPQLFIEGYSRFDVRQGTLGDCWLLAAMANLTLYRRLFFRVVLDDQNFEDKYAGIFHFRFWQFGRWIDVVVDDRLPTRNGKLIYVCSSEDNEFWSALLEKAYAKLNGSYEALSGGLAHEAMVDFTGGVSELYNVIDPPQNLFQIMLKAYERSSLMSCSITRDPEILEHIMPEGLIMGHAYSITKVRYVDIQTPNVSGKICLLRLRNPWGNEFEWNGPWSDGAPEWRFISDADKDELGLTFDHDGEFWMCFADFQKHFHDLEICNLNPDSLSKEDLIDSDKKKWEISVYEGEWVRGVTAGGCRNYLDTFHHNPQYTITLVDADEGAEEPECTIVVALMQKNRRRKRNIGAVSLPIGFVIYHLPYPDEVPKPLDLNFFKYNPIVAQNPSFIDLREVTCRFKLPPGTYCIVPSTFEANEEGEFLLRVFSENRNNMEECDEEIGYCAVDEEALGNFIKSMRLQGDLSDDQDETDKAHESFLKLAGEDEEIDYQELQDILNLCKFTEASFSSDICHSMVAMMDADRSGKLGYEEFKILWMNLLKWRAIWLKYDQEKLGTFKGFELREALRTAGYRLNSHLLNTLMHRYGNKAGEIKFDEFLLCAIRMKTMIDLFLNRRIGDTATATFTLEEWVTTTLYS